jgi:hypothetical protein
MTADAEIAEIKKRTEELCCWVGIEKFVLLAQNNSPSLEIGLWCEFGF